MKNVSFNPLAIMSLILLVSCTTYSFEEEGQADTEEHYTLNAQVQIKDPWTEVTRTDIGDTDPLFMCYLFDSNGNCIYNRGNVIKAEGNKTTFKEVQTAGSYSIFCVTGWYLGEYPKSTAEGVTIDLDTELSIPAAKEMGLGKADVYVNASQYSYNVTVTVDQIMAKAAFTIEKVPLDVTAISVTLPKQANKFKFNGTILGEDQSQTLTLMPAETANDGGTKNWSVAETIVFPFASEGANVSMPIYVNVTNSNGTSTFKTGSTTKCTKGKRVAYKTEWESMTYIHNTNIVINGWTTEVIETVFNLGNLGN